MLGLNDATQNGSTLSTTQIGTQQAAMAPIGTQPVGGAVSGVDVSATSGVNPVGGAGQQQGGFFRNGDGSFNTGNLQLVMGGIQTLGSLWNSYQQHKIAKEQLGLARETFQTNLENNRQTYNTALEDRIRARHNTEGRAASETDAYLDENRL